MSQQKLLIEGLKLAEVNRVLMEERKKSAKEWMKTIKTNQQKRVPIRKKLLDNLGRASDDVSIGNMYFYSYDATTKDKLPYWDFHPLCLPFSMKSGGFFGLNLHYLPPRIRAILLDDVLKFNKKGNPVEPTKSLIQQIASYAEFKPAIHQYVIEGVKSHFVKIPFEEWEQVVYLPLADWRSTKKKPHQNKVYSDSAKRVI